MIGRTLLHYEILGKLGEGGMGEVYLARDAKLKRQVALKLLPPELASNQDRLARFQREAQMLAALDHPNIVHIYSVELDGDLHFLTMQLIEGRRLSDLIPEGGTLSLDEFFQIAIPLADALRAAHDKGITHRDLKPTNVMIDDEGRVKILDFGLAKLRHPDPGPDSSELPTEEMTQHGVVLGTVPYMSPEQVQGEPLDSRTDVFSLGVVLYELLTGRQPFQGSSSAAVISSILRDTPPPVTEVRPELPEPLGRIVGRCLEKEPGRRYPGALELYDELRALRDEASAAPAIRPGPAARAASRSRSRLEKAGLGALAIALVAVVFLVLDRRPSDDAGEAVPAVAQARGSAIAIIPFTVRGSPAYEYLGEGLVDLLSTKLDGAGELRAVDPNAVLGYVSERIEGVPSPAEARALAAHFDAGLHVVGEIVEVGGSLHVSASLYRAGETVPVSQASVEGPADELFGLIDRLAAELVTEQVSGPGAEFTRLAAVTTESLPALKLYLQGENELRGGQFTAALDTFERTVELDPDFALAWYRLSVAAEWAIRMDLVEAAAQEAVRLSERLSRHHQRLLEARLVSRQGRPLEAERLYRAILGTHPEDVEAWTQLAEVLSHYSHVTGRSMVESREAWERILALEPDLTLALWHLVRVEALERRDDRLQATVDRLIELTPEAERVHELEAIRAFVTGDAEAQAEVLAGLDGVADGVVALIAWNLSLVMDSTEGTEQIARVLASPQRSSAAQGLGHSMLAYVGVARGRWREAQRHLERAHEIVPHLGLEHRAYLSSFGYLPVSREALLELRQQILSWDAGRVPPSGLRSFFFSVADDLHPMIRVFLLGLLSARLGDESALEHADALMAASGSSNRGPVLENFAHSIRAAWWQHQGDDRRSFEALEGLEGAGISYQDAFASPFFSLPYERFRRAELAMELGDAESARRWFSSLAEVSFYDDALVGLSHLHRGQLAESRGEPQAAERHYRTFLGLWAEADPELESWVGRGEQGVARTSAKSPPAG